MILLTEVAEHSGYVHETLEILTSPAHITAEIIIEIVGNVLQALLLFPIVRPLWRKWLAKHDREVHHGN